MARIPDHQVEQVLSATDIVDLVSEYLTLKRTGGRYKGLCPFHQEKTPSFTVNPSMGIFKCFGCGKGGNAISFVMEAEGLGYPQAIRHLAGKAGITIAKESEEDLQQRSREERLQAVVRLAMEHYRKRFQQEMHAGSAVAAYVRGRDIARECEETFQLGWADDAWQTITELGARQGFPQDLLVESGLCVQNENGRVYDRYRGRLIFPIRSVSGTVIGFGGRLIEASDDAAKYINSPESPLYHKGRTLYGLFECKNHIRHERCVILVEGYLDLVRLYGAGIKHVAASLGTALTLDQAMLLKRFADRVIFLYDGDSAGQKAMARGALSLLAAGLDLRVCRLPQGVDPDDHIRETGAEGMQQSLDASVDYFQYRIDEFRRIQRDATPAEFKDFVQGLSSAAGQVEDLVMRSQVCQRISMASGVPIHEVERLSRDTGHQTPRKQQSEGPVFLDLKALTKDERRERDLIELFMRCPQVRDTLSEELDLALVRHPFFSSAIKQAMMVHMSEDSSLDGWVQSLGNEQMRRFLLQAATEAVRPGDEKLARDLLIMLEQGRIEARLKEIQQQLRDPALAANLLQELDQEFAELIRQRSALRDQNRE